MMRMTKCLAVAAVLVLMAACSDDDDDAADSSTTVVATTTMTSAPPTTSAPVTTAAVSTTTEETSTTIAPAETTTEVPDSASASTSAPPGTTAPAIAPEWVMHDAPEDCMCADGSPFEFWSRTDDPERVMLYFQGGGACFSAGTCSFTDGSYDPTVDASDDPAGANGVLDFDNPDNPFAGWSVVYVPYCTGDVHLGDTTTEYAPDLTVEHNGFPNAMAGLDFLVENFPDAAHVFVTGSSAGGIPSPLFGGLASDRLPDAEIAVLADASGGYQSVPGINAAIGSLWGTVNNIPDWPETSGIPIEQWGVPDQFVYAGRHDPDIRMARYDNAWDETQREFAAATGMGEPPLPQVLDLNEALVESAGVDLSVYVAPGEMHTILLRPDVYTLTVAGVPFVDWLTEFVQGGVPGDVHCEDCEPPAGVSP
jgi:hypothetical protein